jgi:hypothetical protein
VNLSANRCRRRNRYLNFELVRPFKDPEPTGEQASFAYPPKCRSGRTVPSRRRRQCDATREELLEQRAFRFNASCYNIGLEMREFQEFRTGAPRSNRDIRLSIDLKNIGSFPINLPGTLDSVFRF